MNEIFSGIYIAIVLYVLVECIKSLVRNIKQNDEKEKDYEDED